MKQRLAVINILLPCLCLLVLGYAPDASFILPNYVVLGLLLFTMGRAFLLHQQQVVFSVLPMILLSLPASFDKELNVFAPFALQAMALYLMVVNMQWGQRPWLHGLHVFNLALLFVYVGFASSAIPIPQDMLIYAGYPVWVVMIAACIPLPLSFYWRRMGRLAAYWPLIAIVATVLEWCDLDYLILWVTIAALFSLTLDSYVMSFVDELTGVLGRRAMTFKLKALRSNYCLAMLDVDHFKKFNDKHGHQVGDDVLKVVAKLMDKTEGATAYRYGGEEFVLVFAKGSVKETMERVEACRKRIEEYELYPKSLKRPKQDAKGKDKRGKVAQGKPLHVTVSFGLAQQQSREHFDSVIARADKALYRAKDKGRNRIEMAK